MLSIGKITAVFLLAGMATAAGCSVSDDARQSTEKDTVDPQPQAAQADAGRPAADSQPQTQASAKETRPVVIIETSLGNITVELWPDKAPITVENFLTYVDESFYDGTVFHRVIADFMIQGGGLTPQLQRKATRDPIQNEASADLRNDRGTIAMARTDQIHSATGQFFINVVDNNFLNHRDETPRGFGYAAFGKVVDGMDVVDLIRNVPTTTAGGMGDVPVEPVVINRIRRAD